MPYVQGTYFCNTILCFSCLSILRMYDACHNLLSDFVYED